eukprot:6213199-Pleurochrysis_carterae.AAC.2
MYDETAICRLCLRHIPTHLPTLLLCAAPCAWRNPASSHTSLEAVACGMAFGTEAGGVASATELLVLVLCCAACAGCAHRWVSWVNKLSTEEGSVPETPCATLRVQEQQAHQTF